MLKTTNSEPSNNKSLMHAHWKLARESKLESHGWVITQSLFYNGTSLYGHPCYRHFIPAPINAGLLGFNLGSTSSQ